MDLLEIVASDLTYLDTDWHERVDDHTLRRSTPILRRLLHDGDLSSAWKRVGNEEQPILRLPDFESHLGVNGLMGLRFGLAGGAKYQGTEAQAILIWNRALSSEEIEKTAALGPIPPFRDFIIQEAMESPCVVVDQMPISRRLVLLYVANKLGGAHHDERRRSAGEKRERFYRLLDEVYGKYEVAGKDAIFYEILSLGQALVNSSDVRTLRRQLREQDFPSAS